MSLPVAIVTGASSGIGAATAAFLARNGYEMYGTSRKAGSVAPDGVTMLALDVTDDGSVAAFASDVLSRCDAPAIVVNNAGRTLMGALEETSLAEVRSLFETNYYGVIRVANAFLPAMRAKRGGRIINISSVVGLLPAPYMGYYSSTKHALEGWSETLDHELRSRGVRSILVEPGFTKTAIDASAERVANPLPAYDGERARVSDGLGKNVEAGVDPLVVAQTVLRAARDANPKLRYQAGSAAQTLAVLRKLVPAGLFAQTLRKQFALD